MESTHLNLIKRGPDFHLRTKTLGIVTFIIYIQIVKMIVLIHTSDFWVREDFRVIVALLTMQMYQSQQIGHDSPNLWSQEQLLIKIMLLWTVRHKDIFNFLKIYFIKWKHAIISNVETFCDYTWSSHWKYVIIIII